MSSARPHKRDREKDLQAQGGQGRPSKRRRSSTGDAIPISSTSRSSLDGRPLSRRSDDNSLRVCAICMEQIRDPASLNACDHTFCVDCIVEWGTKVSSCSLTSSRFHE